MLNYGKSHWRTLESGLQKEWLATNGIGGYASSTLINLNSRKYHGLLVAAHNPPGRRLLHLAKLDERFRAGSCTFNLAANENRSGFRETGFIHLQRVRVEPFPTFTYSFKDISLDKTVFLVHGENSTVILYRVYNGTAPAVLSLVPLVNGRGHHCVTRRDELQFKQGCPGGVSIAVAGGGPAGPAAHLQRRHLYTRRELVRGDVLQGGKGAGRERPGRPLRARTL